MHSTLVQGLIELRRTGKYSNNKIIEDMLQELSDNPRLTNEVDKAVNRHKFNDNSIKFSQIPLLNKSLLELSGGALKLLYLLQSYMTQGNIVEARTEYICDILKIKERAYRNYKQELLEANVIISIENWHKGSSPRYMVNPRLFHHCKDQRGLIFEFWDKSVNTNHDIDLEELKSIVNNRDKRFSVAIDGYDTGIEIAKNMTPVGILKPKIADDDKDTKKEPSDGGTSADSDNQETTKSSDSIIPKKSKKNKASKGKHKEEDNTIPGQMTFDDPEIQKLFGGAVNE